MTLPDATCPDCHVPLRGHPDDSHVCTYPLCLERAEVAVQRGRSRVQHLLCDRHTRAAVVTAERFGQALVLMRIPTSPTQDALL